MTSLSNRATKIIIGAAALAAIAAALLVPGHASAADTDDPWPELPSCSNETGTCSSMEDIIAYECYMENEDVKVGNFCDDPLAELMKRGIDSFIAPQPGPDAEPLKLVAPTSRR